MNWILANGGKEPEVYDGLCCGCASAVKQENINLNELYLQLLCGHCRAELERLPLRHKITFDKLKRAIGTIAGEIKFLERKVLVLERFILAHGLNPQTVDDSYINNKLNIENKN